MQVLRLRSPWRPQLRMTAHGVVSFFSGGINHLRLKARGGGLCIPEHLAIQVHHLERQGIHSGHPARIDLAQLVRVDDFEQPLESPLTGHVELPPGASPWATPQPTPLAVVETLGKLGDGMGPLTPGSHRQRRNADQAGNGVAHALGAARIRQPLASVSP